MSVGRGGIINVCSTASLAAAAQMGPYNVTKAAVLAFSETLAAEMSGSGIAVTALCPTFVKTNIVRDARTPANTSKIAQRLMDWTGVSPESVAKTTLDALDRKQLYVLPQFDARLVWRMKRLAPVSCQTAVASMSLRVTSSPTISSGGAPSRVTSGRLIRVWRASSAPPRSGLGR